MVRRLGFGMLGVCIGLRIIRLGVVIGLRMKVNRYELVRMWSEAVREPASIEREWIVTDLTRIPRLTY